ncbi:hypothetical protein FNF29_07701 [Cafeteria roenbergensis]|uniref:Uncharacterized protein n=1 Tax=Cafeteria roenbergensis TaxID=33653 RepID=A0A5A8C2L0_CAFRO|nr:hypothetical protein FNF29_07701 [Cafeteria roenbergensis]|eukprot:KAA0146964.1 hypothetical protein FNF29_07701 [Cafeteria roenbergensis]
MATASPGPAQESPGPGPRSGAFDAPQGGSRLTRDAQAPPPGLCGRQQPAGSALGQAAEQAKWKINLSLALQHGGLLGCTHQDDRSADDDGDSDGDSDGDGDGDGDGDSHASSSINDDDDEDDDEEEEEEEEEEAEEEGGGYCQGPGSYAAAVMDSLRRRDLSRPAHDHGVQARSTASTADCFAAMESVDTSPLAPARSSRHGLSDCGSGVLTPCVDAGADCLGLTTAFAGVPAAPSRHHGGGNKAGSWPGRGPAGPRQVSVFDQGRRGGGRDCGDVGDDVSDDVSDDDVTEEDAVAALAEAGEFARATGFAKDDEEEEEEDDDDDEDDEKEEEG